MEFLNIEILHRTIQQWAIAVGTAVGLWLVLVTAKRILKSRLGAISKRTATTVDDLIAEMVRRLRPSILLILAFWPALQILDAPERVRTVAHFIMVIVVTIQMGIWGQLLIEHFLVTRVTTLKKDDPGAATTLGGVTMLARLALWVLLLIIALDNLGVDVTTLVAGLGIGGVAVALALQNVLGDLFASLSIALDKPFVVGDFIVVGDLRGTVEKVGLKTTRVRSLSGEQLVFSNNDLLSSRIHNYKRMQERRIQFNLGVTYNTPYDKLKEIPGMIKEIIVDDPATRFDRCHFSKYGDFNLDIETIYFVLSPDYNTYMDIQQRINLAVFKKFEEEGIEFAFPTQTVYLKKDAAEAS